MKTDPAIPCSLPVVVQLGFAGSRRLLDTSAHPEINETDFLAGVQAKLTERLRQLRVELKLSPHHFFCGLSQIAIGGDTLFTHACQTLEIPQRILLTQPPEEYLAACRAWKISLATHFYYGFRLRTRNHFCSTSHSLDRSCQTVTFGFPPQSLLFPHFIRPPPVF